MENVEDDSQTNNDDWEDLEIEDDMENMVDICLFVAYKKVQDSCYSTGQVYWKWKFNFFKDDLGGDALSGAASSCFP